MKLNILAIFSILVLSILIAACGGGPVANNSPAPVNSASVPKTNVNSPVAVTTPTPGTATNVAPTLTPVYQAFCNAMSKKDEAGIRKVYSADTLKDFDEQMKADKIKSLVKFLEDDDPAGNCSVKNEVITGDKAVAEIVSKNYPNGFKVVFIKENGEWKMTTQSPTFDAMKPGAPNAPVK